MQTFDVYQQAFELPADAMSKVIWDDTDLECIYCYCFYKQTSEIHLGNMQSDQSMVVGCRSFKIYIKDEFSKRPPEMIQEVRDIFRDIIMKDP